ncbi:MAG: tetratricopeptide repeat protein, partial [Chloroflexi bacterium]|nr:tetratricopeptide repeat protein [Chloroflexota bacterium]
RILMINPQYASAYYNIACSFALQNQPEEAFPYLSQAIQLDRNLRTMARTDPDFVNLRRDRRFQKLVE